MEYKVKGTGAKVKLDKDTFIAQGGEGTIHILNGMVYKICEPGKMIPAGKFTELNVLTHPRIIKPEDIVLEKNGPVGYTMKAVPGNPIPLAQMLTKNYRDREGISGDDVAVLVKQIHDGIKNGIHSHKGYLQVDGNQLNYMVTNNHKDVYFIDVNSYQTPSYPADAIMPSIRDWKAGTNFTELTDWYSFAIISWYMLTAIHPFMQFHPRFTNRKTSMVDQMTAGISILDKDSDFPKGAVYFPFENAIPGGANGAYMQWYRAIFLENKRLPPPNDFQAVLGAIITQIKEISGSNNFDIKELRQFMGQITGFLASNGVEIVTTTDKIYVSNQPQPRLEGRFRVGFTEKNIPVALAIVDGSAQLFNLTTRQWMSQHDNDTYQIPCNDIMSCEGRLYIHSGQQIYEVSFLEVDSLIIPTTKHVAQVMPNATKMFQGVVIQNMMGSCLASIFPQAGHHRQIKLNEITPHLRIVEAKYERNVLMILTIDNESGQYDRLIFRFDPSWNGYTVRKVENITPTGLNFTVMEKGIVVCLTEEEKIEMFTNKSSDPNVKVIDDPVIKSNMKLCHSGAQVRFAHDDKLFSISVKKGP